ncbi:MAG: 1-(5-phosphoribosyl)-5-[(5-phosphoribosylamino)methylideneamino]imidazole-4-carboxamide isomerase [Chloroflexota bacterium]
MIVIPAIDIRGGRCVRLIQGRPEDETVFSDDPVEMARRWTREGAERLHVVNLDGAFAAGQEDNAALLNRRIIADMASAVDVPIQLGGGLHSIKDIEEALRLGVDRIIMGTVAVEKPTVVAHAVRRWGAERILVGIDGWDGMVMTHGWQRESSTLVLDLALLMKSLGIVRIVYTDVQRDGMLVGVNLEATAKLARESGLRVIASGGVRSLNDIVALLPLEPEGVEGVIAGRALYTGSLDLGEALRVCKGAEGLPGGVDAG